MATADRLVDLYRREADVVDPADPTLRDAVIQAWIDAEAYRWQTFLTVTRHDRGRQRRAPSRA